MILRSKNKTNRLKANILYAVVQTITQTIVLLVLYRYLLDSLGVDKLGIWAIVLATASAARVSELGLAGSVTKFVATYRSQGNEQAAAEALQTAVITIGVVLGIILVLAYPALQWALLFVLPVNGIADGRAILPYAMISLWLTAVSAIWMGGLDGCLRSDLRAGLMILGSLIFLFISLLSVDRYGLVGLAIAQVIQGMVLVFSGWLLIRKVMLSATRPALQWKTERLREMLGYGVNFQINSVVMLLFEPVTKILLGRYGELAAAGYFEMAQRLVMKIRALIVESNRVIVPVLAGIDSHGTDTRNYYKKNVRYLFFLVTPMFATLLAFAPTISELWIGSIQNQFNIMVLYLTLAWYLNSITAPAYFAYLGQGKLRWVTVGHIVMGSSNVVAGLILGGEFGWQGIIVAFVLSLSLGSVIPVITYHYEHKHSVSEILSIHDFVLFFILFSAALVGYWLSIHLDISVWLRVLFVAIGMGGMTIVAIWFHPLRQQVFILIKSRLKNEQKKDGV